MVALAVATLSGACDGGDYGEDTGENVVLITLDGVRQREMFGTPDPTLSGGDEELAFPLLWESLATEGVMYGDPRRFDVMTTTNDAQVSLPGYMSIFTGYEQPCYDNDCTRVRAETVLEFIHRVRGFAKEDVAVFASWEKIGRALEHVVGTIYTDIGPTPDLVDLPPWPARWDRDTFAAAMEYLETRRPRLLYIALLDADAWGHAHDYGEYLAALRRYDVWIAEVRTRLAAMGDYGARTTLIVTTDHGRGDGELWYDHNSELPGADRVWLYALGPHVAPGVMPEPSVRSSADIRPTLEVLFGIPPTSCVRCGNPLLEVTEGVP